MSDGKDLFIETVRRIELVVYITTNADMTGINSPKIIQGSKINLSQKKHSQIVNFRSKNNLNLQRNFISLSPIFGYLMTLDIAEMLKKEEKDRKSWSLLKRKKKSADEYKWEEKFYVLGSLGLIIMDKPNSDKLDFYPNNQFKVEIVPEVRYLRKNCFEIMPRTSQIENARNEKLVLQAPNSDVVKSWIQKLKEHQQHVFNVIHQQKK